MKEQVKSWVLSIEVEDEGLYSQDRYGNWTCNNETRELLLQKDKAIEMIQEDTSAQYFKSIEQEWGERAGNNAENDVKAEEWLSEKDLEIIKMIGEL